MTQTSGKKKKKEKKGKKKNELELGLETGKLGELFGGTANYDAHDMFVRLARGTLWKRLVEPIRLDEGCVDLFLCL